MMDLKAVPGGPRGAVVNYRRCVGVMLFNRDGHVLVGQRLDRMVEAWQMPQGGVDDGEAPDAAVLREMREEIGTDNAKIITGTADWLAYDLPKDLQGKLWKGKYRGQIQKWYLMKFLGSDSDIDINTEHPEFRNWRWCPVDELVALAVPFKRGIYSEVIRRFGDILNDPAAWDK